MFGKTFEQDETLVRLHLVFEANSPNSSSFSLIVTLFLLGTTARSCQDNNERIVCHSDKRHSSGRGRREMNKLTLFKGLILVLGTSNINKLMY